MLSAAGSATVDTNCAGRNIEAQIPDQTHRLDRAKRRVLHITSDMHSGLLRRSSHTDTRRTSVMPQRDFIDSKTHDAISSAVADRTEYPPYINAYDTD
jgi:hypothetical protein